jgi:hypothetical protein
MATVATATFLGKDYRRVRKHEAVPAKSKSVVRSVCSGSTNKNFKE